MLTVSQTLAQNNTYRYQKYQSTLSSFRALPVKKGQEEVSKEKNKKIKKTFLISAGILTTGILLFKGKKIIEFLKKMFNTKNNPPDTSSNNPPTEEIKDKAEDLVSKTEEKIKAKVQKAEEKIVKKKAEVLQGNYYNYDVETATKEVFVSKVYNATDVAAIEKKYLGDLYSYHGTISKYIENLQKINPNDEDICKNICSGFATDVLLANGNILKTCKQTPNGDILRVNFSSVFNDKNMGHTSFWGLFPTEIADFFDEKKYPENASVYRYLTRDILIKSLQDTIKIRENKYAYNDALRCTDGAFLTEIITNRTSFLARFLKIAKETEQGDLTISEYVENIKNNLIEQTIARTNNSFQILEEIKLAVDKIKNPEEKERIKQIYDKKIEELETDPNRHLYKISKLLNNYYNRKVEISEELEDKLVKTFGSKSAMAIKNRISTPLTLNNIKDAGLLYQKLNDANREFFNQNPELLAAYISSNLTQKNRLDYFDETAWNTTINHFKRFVESNIDKDAYIKAINDYSGFGIYDNINETLRMKPLLENLIKFTEDFDVYKSNISYIKNEIDMLCIMAGRMVGTKTISQDLKSIVDTAKNIVDLYRTSDMSQESSMKILNDRLSEFKKTIASFSVKAGVSQMVKDLKSYNIEATELDKELILNRFASPITFHQIMLDSVPMNKILEQKVTPEILDKLNNYINKNKIIIQQPEFLSTSIAPYKVETAGIKFSIKLEKGVKYSYVDDINHLFKAPNEGLEAEILIHPGHLIEITRAREVAALRGKRLVFDAIIKPA